MKIKHIVLSAVVLFGLASCGSKEETPTTENTPESTNVVESHGQAGVAAVEGEEKNALQVAMSMDDFKTLVVAVQTAGVEDALVNAGPLTIFAPVNEAFDKLPEGTVETLLKPESKGQLTTILINHVAPANYPIKQLKKEAKKGRKLYMASGEYLEVENRDGKIFVGGTEILQSVKVSNGWVHVIADVLVPVSK